jgi:hypothetical protein
MREIMSDAKALDRALAGLSLLQSRNKLRFP